MAQLSIQSWISNKQKEVRPEDMKIMEDRVLNTKVEMCARLSTNSIKIGDLMNLNHGDVLVFDKSIHEKFELLLAGKTKFYGKPGIVGKKVAVKITDIKTKTEGKENG